MFEDDDTRTIYEVVVNHEQQYSLWPAERLPPSGWAPAGVRGTRADCLAHIEKIWTDMRPLSIRVALCEDC